MADDQSKKPHVERKTHIVELTGGLQTDQFAESVPVTDCNNVEVLPSAGGMFNRRGHVRWTKYAPKTDPEGRIALLVDSQPPNMSDGTWLISAVDTSVQTNPVVYLQPFKPRTNLSNDTLISQVFFASPTYFVNYGEEAVLTLNRIGALDRVFTVDWATEDGTAEAGVDYTAATGTVTFESGDRSKDITVQSLGNAYEADKSFTVKITDVSVGGVATSPDKATVVLEGSSMQLFPVATRVMPYPVYPGIIASPEKTETNPEEYAHIRTVYFAVWCVDMTQTPSNRIALYVIKRDILWSDFNYASTNTSYNIGMHGSGVAAVIGTNSVAFSAATFASDASRILIRIDASTTTLRSGSPSYLTGSMVSSAPLQSVVTHPTQDLSFVVPIEHTNGVGVLPITDPDTGDVALVGRNAIYFGGSSRIDIQRVAGDTAPSWNGQTGISHVGNPSGRSTEALWAGDGCFWQMRVATLGGTRRAVLCKINLYSGQLDKYVLAPAGVTTSTFLVLMDDGTPMLFSSGSTPGQWILNESDEWTQLSSSALLRAISYIHNVGDNEAVYIPHGTNRIARGKLHDDAPLEKLFDFDNYSVEGYFPGPTWMTPTRMFAYNLSATPNTYAIFRVRDGALIETGEFNDAYGAGAIAGGVGELAYKSLSGETVNYGTQTITGVLSPVPLKKAFY